MYNTDCQIELGTHAGAGTLYGFPDHTLTSKKWFSHKINNVVTAPICAILPLKNAAVMLKELMQDHKIIDAVNNYDDLKF